MAGDIKDRVRLVIQGSPILTSVITNNWPLHGWTHEAGGIDEISVEDLSGKLADPQNAGWLDDYEVDLSDPPDLGDVLQWNGTAWIAVAGGGVGLHHTTHEDGGIDEIDVTDLSGVLADPQDAGWLDGFEIDLSTPPDSGDFLYWDGSKWISRTFSLSDLPAHHTTHENGGSDEITVAGLSGVLADPQNAGWLDGYAVNLSVAPTSGYVLTWNGSAWVAQTTGAGTGVTSVNSETGDLTLSEGPNITITKVSTDFEFSVSGLTLGQLVYGDSSGNMNSSAGLTYNGAALAVNTYTLLSHNTVNGSLVSNYGGLILEDDYRGSSTTFTSQMKIADSITDWDNLGTIMGGPKSLAKMLIAAASSGGTWDNSYDFGGAGAGKTLIADSGAATIQNAGENILLFLTQTAASPSLDAVLELRNADTRSEATNSDAILFSGNTGSTYAYGQGHRLFTSESALSMVAEFPTSVSGALSTVACRLYSNDATDVASAYLGAQDSGAVRYSYIRAYAHPSMTQLELYSTTTVFAAAESSIDLRSEGNITLGPGYNGGSADAYTSFLSHDIRSIRTLGFGSDPQTGDSISTGWFSGSNTVVIDWKLGRQWFVDIDDDVSSFVFTNPPPQLGPAQVLTLRATGDCTISGFPSAVDFMEPVDPDAETVTIPGGHELTISFLWKGSTLAKYQGTVLPYRGDG